MAVAAMMPRRERQHGEEGEPGRPCQPPRAVADVSAELFEPRHHGALLIGRNRDSGTDCRLQNDFGTSDLYGKVSRIVMATRASEAERATVAGEPSQRRASDCVRGPGTKSPDQRGFDDSTRVRVSAGGGPGRSGLPCSRACRGAGGAPHPRAVRRASHRRRQQAGPLGPHRRVHEARGADDRSRAVARARQVDQRPTRSSRWRSARRTP